MDCSIYVGIDKQINFPTHTRTQARTPPGFGAYSKLRNTVVHTPGMHCFVLKSSCCLHCLFNTVGSSIDILQIENLPTLATNGWYVKLVRTSY